MNNNDNINELTDMIDERIKELEAGVKKASSESNEILDHKDSGKKIGFKPQIDKEESFLNRPSLREELLMMGFNREFLGRINKVVELESLSRTELKAILLHPSRGVLSKMKKSYSHEGIELEFADNVIEEIVDRILKEKLGARSVQHQIDDLIENAMFTCFEHGYNHMLIDKDTLLEGKIHFSNQCKLK